MSLSNSSFFDLPNFSVSVNFIVDGDDFNEIGEDLVCSIDAENGFRGTLFCPVDRRSLWRRTSTVLYRAQKVKIGVKKNAKPIL